MINTTLVQKSFTDFLSPKFLKYSILPFIVSFAIFAYLYMDFGADAISSFKQSMENGVVPFLDPEEYPILTYILTIGIFKWLFSLFFYLVGAVAVILLSVLISVIVIGFFTPMIVKGIRQKHYPDFIMKNDNFSAIHTLWHFAKTFVIFILLFLIMIPFLFIPAVNFIAINIPFYYLFHNFLVLDVGSSINSQEEFKTVTKKYKLKLRSTTLTLFGFSLIPLVGMLFQVLFVIILAHQFFTRTTELRTA
ncbi:MAG: EI24 domain-containing protein [Epsilonproteobacteria bacterium]|nr:EI24 domain-containing protein [Campylobacterota bacterium]